MADCLKLLLQLLPASAMLAGGIGLCHAQSDASLSDPTRPPTTIIEPVNPTTATEGAPPTNGLQSIILGKGRKPMALINGVTVEIGGKVGDATLVKISESAVVLKGPAGRETLYLTPGVEKLNPLNAIRIERSSVASKPKPESKP